MSRPPLFIATVLVAAVAAVAGCGWDDAIDSRTATAGLPDTRQLIQEHDWVLEPADSSLTVEDDNPMTLSVADDVISGRGPCNRYRGDFSLGDYDDSVQISSIALTLRHCGTSTMQAEDEFTAALGAVDAVEVDEDDNQRLVLHNGGGDVRLVFRSYDADEVLTATWGIVNVAAGDTIAEVVVGTDPTLTFAGDGDLTMETGCSTVTATWELDGHALSIDAARVTPVSCDSPAGAMDQHAALVAALEGADRVEITPGTLTLLADDSITLVAISE